MKQSIIIDTLNNLFRVNMKRKREFNFKIIIGLIFYFQFTDNFKNYIKKCGSKSVSHYSNCKPPVSK
jgi:hypothetical protein